jgi:predicted Zn-dependent protease
MRKIGLIFIGAVLAGCMHLSAEKTVTLVNTGAADEAMLEQIRSFAQKELRVPVRITNEPELAGLTDFQALEIAARQTRQARDAAYIVVTKLDDDRHLEVFEQSGIAIINARPLSGGGASAEIYQKRVQRMVMRAAAFVFGLEPTPDPYCVTRDYQSLEDLDRMGNNYSPPWQARYADEAAKRGLQPVTPDVRFPGAR